MVVPNMASIPKIEETHYNICGSLKLVTSGYYGKRQVGLTHGSNNVNPQLKRIDDMGNFFRGSTMLISNIPTYHNNRS